MIVAACRKLPRRSSRGQPKGKADPIWEVLGDDEEAVTETATIQMKFFLGRRMGTDTCDIRHHATCCPLRSLLAASLLHLDRQDEPKPCGALKGSSDFMRQGAQAQRRAALNFRVSYTYSNSGNPVPSWIDIFPKSSVRSLSLNRLKVSAKDPMFLQLDISVLQHRRKAVGLIETASSCMDESCFKAWSVDHPWTGSCLDHSHECNP